MQRFVIIGSGLAGHTAALELRRQSDDASITLLGEELHLPYDRPPLTKDFLLGRVDESSLTLKSAADYEEKGIAFSSGLRAVEINRDEKTVRTHDGSNFSYDSLLLATGSRPRPVPFDLTSERLCYIRTLDDAIKLKQTLAAGMRVAVIGGGFIGLEVAAAAREMGCTVTVVEAAETILSRTMPSRVSDFILSVHRKNSVEVILGEAPQALEDNPDGTFTIRLSDRTLSADILVAGIGIEPNTELAEAAGLAVDDGIVVDRHCRTSDADIFAAGEVTRHPSGPLGAPKRVESWRIAAQQPLVAAQSMLGRDAVFDDPPWLWSDQYDMNIQSIGDPTAGSRHLLRRNHKNGGWTFLATDEQLRPAGAVAINNGRDISMLRRVMKKGDPLPEAVAAECEFIAARHTQETIGEAGLIPSNT